MNDLEHKIFARALENAYSSVLLGEDQALAYIEHLVYLNRALADSPQRHWPLEAEVSLLRRVCAVCWPERTMDLCLAEGLPASLQVRRTALFAPICRLLLEAAEQGAFPDGLQLSLDGGRLQYRFTLGSAIWRQGEVRYE